MTKGQRIEAKFGNVARAMAQAQRSSRFGFGFSKTATCRGLLPRFKRWKQALRQRMNHLARACH